MKAPQLHRPDQDGCIYLSHCSSTVAVVASSAPAFAASAVPSESAGTLVVVGIAVAVVGSAAAVVGTVVVAPAAVAAGKNQYAPVQHKPSWLLHITLS